MERRKRMYLFRCLRDVARRRRLVGSTPRDAGNAADQLAQQLDEGLSRVSSAAAGTLSVGTTSQLGLNGAWQAVVEGSAVHQCAAVLGAAELGQQP